MTLSVKNLSGGYGQLAVLHDISFDIQAGELLALVGLNGSGKSTTIRMLCGILEPSAGAGRVMGFDIARQSEQIKANIGYMSQKFSL